MSSFAPQPVLTPRNFEIVGTRRGLLGCEGQGRADRRSISQPEGRPPLRIVRSGRKQRPRKAASPIEILIGAASPGRGDGSGPPGELLWHRLLIAPFYVFFMERAHVPAR